MQTRIAASIYFFKGELSKFGYKSNPCLKCCTKFASMRCS